jgi:YHS domain-containing protein
MFSASVFRRLAPGVSMVLLAVAPALALEPINRTFFGGLAVDGYDPVAYFTDGRPVEGRKEITYDWHGATWRFANAEHRELFVAAPEKYAPQYGGYCALAVAHAYTADADPLAWKIVDGRLFLNYDAKIQEKWLADYRNYIVAGDGNWPKLLTEGK